MYNLEIVFKIVECAGYKPIVDSFSPKITYIYHREEHLKDLGGKKLGKEAILFFDEKHQEVIRIQIYKKYCYIGKFSRISNDVFYIKVKDLTSDNLKQHINSLFEPSSFNELSCERYKMVDINKIKDKELIPIYNIIKEAKLKIRVYNIKMIYLNRELSFESLIFEYYNQLYEIGVNYKENGSLDFIFASHLCEIPGDECGLFDILKIKNKEEFLYWLNKSIRINTCDSVIENLKKDIWNHRFCEF